MTELTKNSLALSWYVCRDKNPSLDENDAYDIYNTPYIIIGEVAKREYDFTCKYDSLNYDTTGPLHLLFTGEDEDYQDEEGRDIFYKMIFQEFELLIPGELESYHLPQKIKKKIFNLLTAL